MTNPKPPLDVLIITAMRDEFNAVLRVNQGAAANAKWTTEPGPNGCDIAFRTFAARTGPIRIGVTYATDMGQAATTEAATALINTYDVRCLAMCGVCAGRRGKVNLGDVIIADRVWDYDVGKMIAKYDENGNRQERILGDLTTYQLDPVWKQAAEGWQPDAASDWLQDRPFTVEDQKAWLLERVLLGEDALNHSDKDKRCADWADILRRLWDDGQLQNGTLNLTQNGRQAIEKMRLLAGGVLAKSEPFRTHVGPMGAGSKVVEDAHIFDRLAQTMRKVLGLEMESPAIGAVQHSYRDPVSKMVVMKAVQDFADQDKNKNFRAFATRASAECLIGFLRDMLPSVIEPGFDDLLDSGISDPPDFGSDEPSPSAILNPRYQIAPFFRGGRETILADLDRWRLQEAPVAVRSIYGPGGIGKTRLMIESLKPLRDSGWQIGFLRESTPENWFERLIKQHAPMLVVIDYAESRAKLRDLLEPVLHYFQETCQRPNSTITPVRIVLLSRQIGDWWEALNRKGIDLKTLLNATPPHEMKPLATSTGHRDEIFSQAAQTFAGVCRCLPPASPPIELDEAQFDLVLYLHMAALAVVKGWLFTGSASLMAAILDHEERIWAKQGADQLDAADELWIEQARQWVVAATLLGGLLSREAALALGDALFRSPNELDLQHLHRIYPNPGGYLAPLLPDLLGEAMTLRLIGQVDQRPQDYIARVFTNSSGSQVQRGFEILGRIGVETPEAVPRWIQQLLGLDLAAHTLPAYRAARSLATKTAFSPLAAILCEQLDQGTLEDEVALLLAKALQALDLPNISVSMQGLIEWVSRTQLQGARVDSDEAAQAEKARQLNNQGLYQRELGQRKAALASAQTATDLYQQLSEKNPDAFLPGLARSLNNLGNRQSELGQHEVALTSTQEATNLYQQLSEKNPDAFLPGLAMSLNNLGNQQSELGQHEVALASTQAATDLYQQLSEKNPDAFLPDLARSLNNLGNRQSELGQHEVALTSTQEATNLHQQLSEKNPDAFLPDLATSLNNLGHRQSELGQREAALASTQESVDIRQQLSEKNPDTFLPDLANSLNNLGNQQSELGQREVALTSTQESVDIHRQLSEKNPDAFLPDLASSLNNLGNRQSELGQREAALASTQESVDIRRQLSEKNPDAFLPGLASSLNNLGLRQSKLGQHEAALLSTQAALDLYWPLFEQYPQAFSRYVAISLQNVVRRLEVLHQQPSATLIQRIESFQKHSPHRANKFAPSAD